MTVPVPPADLVATVAASQQFWSTGDADIRGDYWVLKSGKKYAKFHESDAAYSFARHLNVLAAIAAMQAYWASEGMIDADREAGDATLKRMIEWLTEQGVPGLSVADREGDACEMRQAFASYRHSVALNEYERGYQDADQMWALRMDAERAAMEHLRATIKYLREALRPFWGQAITRDTEPYSSRPNNVAAFSGLAAPMEGDLRRARQVYEQSEPKQ